MSDATKKNGLATAALVLGILSIALFWLSVVGVICGILAIIFAIVAKNKIKQDPDLAHTAGKAKGGLIMGIIGVVLWLVMLIIAIMFLNKVAGDLEDAMENRIENSESFDEFMENLEDQ